MSSKYKPPEKIDSRIGKEPVPINNFNAKSINNKKWAQSKKLKYVAYSSDATVAIAYPNAIVSGIIGFGGTRMDAWTKRQARQKGRSNLPLESVMTEKCRGAS